MDFLGLTDSTQLAGTKTAPQGVVRLTNGGNRGRWSDNTTNGKVGGEEEGPPHQQGGKLVWDRRG